MAEISGQAGQEGQRVVALGAAPVDIERALGYRGADRFLFLWWDRIEDTAAWTDGQTTGYCLSDSTVFRIIARKPHVLLALGYKGFTCFSGFSLA